MKKKKPCFHPPKKKIIYSPEEQRRRDIAKHNRVKRRIFKEFKKCPYRDITPKESLAQKIIGKASKDRQRLERRKLKKKLCQKKNQKK